MPGGGISCSLCISVSCGRGEGWRAGYGHGCPLERALSGQLGLPPSMAAPGPPSGHRGSRMAFYDPASDTIWYHFCHLYWSEQSQGCPNSGGWAEPHLLMTAVSRNMQSYLEPRSIFSFAAHPTFFFFPKSSALALEALAPFCPDSLNPRQVDFSHSDLGARQGRVPSSERSPSLV